MVDPWLVIAKALEHVYSAAIVQEGSIYIIKIELFLYPFLTLNPIFVG